MFGQTANVLYKGKTYSFIVSCSLNDTKEEVNNIGLYKLTRLEKEHPELTLDEIVDLINEARL